MTRQRRSASPLALLFLCLLLALPFPAHAQSKSALGPLPSSEPASIAFCDSCHASDRLDRNQTVPDLGGQPEQYLEKQLLDFMRNSRPMLASRDESRNFTGQRDNATIHPTAQDITESDAVDLAHVYGLRTCTQALPPPSRPNAVPAVRARCEVCHGESGQGQDRALVPRLAGEPSPYLFNQLNSMRRAALGLVVPGTASERSHPIMNIELKELEIVDLRTLADYFASLPCK